MVRVDVRPEGRIRSWSSWLVTLTGNGFLLLGTLVFATAAVVLGWIPPRGNLIYGIARLWSRGLLFSSGVRVHADFESALDGREQLVYMANHNSLFDIPALISTLPGQTRFLAKKSLFQIPIFGWALKMGGFVNIDRSDLTTARVSFGNAVERLRGGTSILVFPEGTRSQIEGMLPFKRGGFLLALKSGLAIVPVGLSGSRQVQGKGKLRIRPGVIQIRYGRPVSVQGFSISQKEHLMETVRSQIEELARVESATTGSRTAEPD